ncbi:MAG TPA: ribose-5-phosphate isomerase RpiA [Gaiellales bacterium]|nr:ribose-5-phosphate isomerase RpiA [Gaiellales bacterium]
MTADELKRLAAEHAVEREVRSGMALGLGTGSTAGHVLEALAARLRDGRLAGIRAVPTSEHTAADCRRLGIPLASLDECPHLDVDIDGADEIDPGLDLIKGLGGALLREKVVAAAATRMVVVADGSKLVPRLGLRAPLPVEVIPFAQPLCRRLLERAGWRPQLRLDACGEGFVTDEGNLILDCRRDDWSQTGSLAVDVDAIPGVAGHGLFLSLAQAAVVATDAGVRVLERPAAASGA